jgi:hypothetical protein
MLGMTVRDLIIELLNYNLDAEVCTSYSETIEISYSGNWISKDSDKKITPIIFIDGCDYIEEDD